ncbi:hypothetical protein M432DRAFT_592002 [Thermoascus aurantiacus ATCC 26904]
MKKTFLKVAVSAAAAILAEVANSLPHEHLPPSNAQLAERSLPSLVRDAASEKSISTEEIWWCSGLCKLVNGPCKCPRFISPASESSIHTEKRGICFPPCRRDSNGVCGCPHVPPLDSLSSPESSQEAADTKVAVSKRGEESTNAGEGINYYCPPPCWDIGGACSCPDTPPPGPITTAPPQPAATVNARIEKRQTCKPQCVDMGTYCDCPFPPGIPPELPAVDAKLPLLKRDASGKWGFEVEKRADCHNMCEDMGTWCWCIYIPGWGPPGQLAAESTVGEAAVSKRDSSGHWFLMEKRTEKCGQFCRPLTGENTDGEVSISKRDSSEQWFRVEKRGDMCNSDCIGTGDLSSQALLLITSQSPVTPHKRTVILMLKASALTISVRNIFRLRKAKFESGNLPSSMNT